MHGPRSKTTGALLFPIRTIMSAMNLQRQVIYTDLKFGDRFLVETKDERSSVFIEDRVEMTSCWDWDCRNEVGHQLGICCYGSHPEISCQGITESEIKCSFLLHLI